MDLDTLFRQLHLDPACYNAVARDWLDSRHAFPGSVPDFLGPDYLRTFVPLAGLSADVLASLEDLAATVRGDPAWLALAWHAHRRLSVGVDPIEFRRWPQLDEALAGRGGLFYLLIVCSVLGRFQAVMEAMQLPSRYFEAGCLRVQGMFEKYADSHGRPGVDPRQVHWIRHYVDGRIFRIGRFEYMFTPAAIYNVLVYRQRHTGEVLAVGGPQPRAFRADGQVLYPDEDPTTAAFSGASLHQGGATHALPFDPRGRAVDRVMRLDPVDWEPVVSATDTVAGIHVPPGGAMTPEACRASLTEAFAFFHRYFPTRQVRAAFCASWIFNTDLETLLPDANLAHFMRELYLFPAPSAGNDGLYFIFGREDTDYASYPRDNSVRRALLTILERGDRLRSGGMFFLEEHLPNYGTQVYRTMCRAAVGTSPHPPHHSSSTPRSLAD